MYIESTVLARIVRSARKGLLGRIHIENHDYRQTVFLAGTGRSGTTWVANIINHANAYRLLFEPFNSHAVDIISHFAYRQYLRPENSDDMFLEPAKAILSGRVRNRWIDQLNSKLLVRKRLIKDIRANHLLRWIRAHFPEIPIILLMRHPCAIAHSKLRLNWETNLNVFLQQDELMEDFLSPFREEMNRECSDFEKHILLWCIENYVPLKQFEMEEIHVVFYENLCTEPAKEIEELFRFLGETFEKKSLKAAQRPSSLSRPDSAVVSGVNLTDGWTKWLNENDIRSAVRILKLFGLDKIYSDQTMPLVKAEDIRV